MSFKRKAGLALALAAIFSYGQSNLALAASDNVTGMTSSSDGVATIGSGSITGSSIDTTAIKPDANGNLVITGSSTDLTTGEGKGLSLDGGGTVKKLTLTDVALIISGSGGALISSNGTLVDSVTVNKDVTVGDPDNSNSGGSLGTLEMTAGDLTLVGGDLSVKKLIMADGTTILADPAWDGANYNPARLPIEFMGAGAKSTINTKIEVAQNTQMAVGTADKNWLSDIVRKTGRDSNGKIDGTIWSVDNGVSGYTAAFGIFAPQILDETNGGIVVEGADDTPTTPTGGKIEFFDQSLFAVNLVEGQAAISALTPGNKLTLNIGDGTLDTHGTGIYLANGRHGVNYTLINDIKEIAVNGDSAIALTGTAATDAATLIAALEDGADPNHWVKDFSSDLLTGEFTLVKNSNNGYALGIEMKRNPDVSVSSLYPHLSSGLAGMVETLYGSGDLKGRNDDWSDNAGIAFVSRLTNDDSFMSDHREAAAVLEGAAQIAVAAGAPVVAGNVITKLSTLVVDHNNMLNATQPAYGNEPGKLGIWATPFYGISDVDGMDAGRFESGYEMNYGGAAFGIDFNINEAFRLGLALNVGGGDTESKGDFSKTENDFDFFGVSLYGSYTNGSFGLTGDVGFTGVDNEIDQRLPGSMYMGGGLESNVDSDAFTLGLTGQYRFAASDNFNITPHLGLRYTKISVDDATVELTNNGGRVFKVATEDQNLFQIPLGVKFSSDIATAGGWTITPSADLGVLFTTGDTDVESRATIYGTGISGRTNADVNDTAAFTGALGIKAAADNGLSLGLDYGILASGNQTDHQFSGMLRFEF